MCNDWQTYGANELYAECSLAKRIDNKDFSRLSCIAAEKLAVPLFLSNGGIDGLCEFKGSIATKKPLYT